MGEIKFCTQIASRMGFNVTPMRDRFCTSSRVQVGPEQQGRGAHWTTTPASSKPGASLVQASSRTTPQCSSSLAHIHTGAMTTQVLLAAALAVLLVSLASTSTVGPEFVRPISNITIKSHLHAKIDCLVNNVDGFNVTWLRGGTGETLTTLIVHKTAVSRDPRIAVTQKANEWRLHVENVQEADSGWYTCQVDTDPVLSQQTYLQVVVPPSWVETSSDMLVLEGTNATMTCKATGVPEPHITWSRADEKEFQYNGGKVNSVDGEKLEFTQVTRQDSGVYLCVASNEVPPPITKPIKLNVKLIPIV